jgi:hypothetical protein
MATGRFNIPAMRLSPVTLHSRDQLTTSPPLGHNDDVHHPPALVPLLVLVVSGIGWLPTDTAMWIAMWVLVAELGIIAFLAVRRAHLHWWQKVFVATALAGVGALVVAVKMLAH